MDIPDQEALMDHDEQSPPNRQPEPSPFPAGDQLSIESNGMLLAASDAGGQPILVGFEKPPEPGTRIK
ncbi:MAG: hypothetical protein AB1806_06070 [Acidobacteriota bacterium]